MTETFDFTENGRTYSCSAEVRGGTEPTTWWWFRVSGDRNRYAPFHAVSGEPHGVVQERIVSYYGAVLERRGLPPSVFPR